MLIVPVNVPVVLMKFIPSKLVAARKSQLDAMVRALSPPWNVAYVFEAANGFTIFNVPIVDK